jgi:hypothetical protein
MDSRVLRRSFEPARPPFYLSAEGKTVLNVAPAARAKFISSMDSRVLRRSFEPARPPFYLSAEGKAILNVAPAAQADFLSLMDSRFYAGASNPLVRFLLECRGEDCPHRSARCAGSSLVLCTRRFYARASNRLVRVFGKGESGVPLRGGPRRSARCAGQIFRFMDAGVRCCARTP